MKQTALIATALSLAMLATATAARAHCQIPCGIYDDEVRFTLMLEDVATIEKSMAQIKTLAAAPTPNWNQLVRWVTNKEQHADRLADIVTSYFMAQRIKPAAKDDAAAYKKYVAELTLLHRIVVTAMKAKQTTDAAYCTTLRQLITEFRSSYAGKAG